MKLKEINEMQLSKIFSIVSVAMTCLMILSLILDYYRMRLSLKNPLIPESLISYASKIYLKMGIALGFGLILIILLKIVKQNLLVILSFLIVAVASQLIY
jgi:hypothetical protein